MALTHHLRENIFQSKKFGELNKEAEILAKSCRPAKVPSLDHLTMSDYELVYEPSDDTFLLMDALQYEFDYDNADAKLKLQRASLIRITLEMGCGSGVGSICLAKLLMEQRERTDEITEKYNVNHYVTDINENAIRTTLETATRNGLCDSAVNAYKCDLATPLLDELQDSVDVLLFNPPYVPTPDVDVKGSSIETSWAGGTDGRLVLDRALPQIAHLLSWPHGVACKFSFTR